MKLIALLVTVFLSLPAIAQQEYFQQSLRYTIAAELNDETNSITGNEVIVYKNNSGTSLDFIWFHIWPNAYKNKNTALYQQIKADAQRAKKLENAGNGSISGLAFKINGQPAVTQPHPNPVYIDIIKLVLSKPLAPGDSLTISTPFKTILPPYFSRSGYSDGEFMACQWYPKPAVFDRDGWHEFPYLDMGEFYSEFADYDVSISLPSTYIVGATGVLQNQDELDQYKKTGAQNVADRKGKPALYVPSKTSEKKTLRYLAQQVPDFAWFADKNFAIQYDTVQFASGRVVDAFSYYHNKKNTLWKNSIDYVKEGVHTYSNWVGEYAYPVVQAVEGPANNSSGGMEYPMVTLITNPNASTESLDGVIVHEVGHNWFMGMLGSNERAHTWLDEGLNTYLQFRYEAQKYRANSIFGDAVPKEFKKLSLEDFQRSLYNGVAENIPMQSAMDISAEKFPNSDEYGLVSYVKTAYWLYLLEASIGWDKMQAAFHTYFNNWKFKHPRPEDLKASFEESIGGNLDKYFDLIHKEGKFE